MLKFGLLSRLSTLILQEELEGPDVIPESLNGIWRTIPTTIGLLTDLQTFDLFYNALTGTIPSPIGFMTRLSCLSLSNNFISTDKGMQDVGKKNDLLHQQYRLAATE